MPQVSDPPSVPPPAGGAPSSNGHGSTPPPTERGLLERPLIRRTLIVVMLAAAVALVVVIANNAVTGSDSASDTRPASIDRLIPASGAQVLRQAQVGVDLAPGYDAYLIINGTEIRNQATGDDGDGLTRSLTAGGYTITYTPAPGRRIEELEPDVNRVTAMIWQQSQGPTTASPTYWTFSAT
jgi:hypothetical protein